LRFEVQLFSYSIIQLLPCLSGAALIKKRRDVHTYKKEIMLVQDTRFDSLIICVLKVLLLYNNEVIKPKS